MFIGPLKIYPGMMLHIEPYENMLHNMARKFRIKRMSTYGWTENEQVEAIIMLLAFNETGNTIENTTFNAHGKLSFWMKYDQENREVEQTMASFTNNQETLNSSRLIEYFPKDSDLIINCTDPKEEIHINFDSNKKPFKVTRQGLFITYPNESIEYNQFGLVDEITGKGDDANYLQKFSYNTDLELVSQEFFLNGVKQHEKRYVYKTSLLIEEILISKGKTRDTIAPRYHSYDDSGLLTGTRIPYGEDLFERYEYEYWE